MKNVFPDKVLQFFNWNVWITSFTREGNMASALHLPPCCSPERSSSGNLELSAAASPLQLQMYNSFPLAACSRAEEGKKKCCWVPLLHGNEMGCVWAYSHTSKIMTHLFQTAAPDHPEPAVAIAQDSGAIQTCVSWLLATRDYVLFRWGQMKCSRLQSPLLPVPVCPLSQSHIAMKNAEKRSVEPTELGWWVLS